MFDATGANDGACVPYECDGATLQHKTLQLSPTSRKLLDHLHAVGGHIRAAIPAIAAEAGVSERSARTALQRLVETGAVVRIGGGRGRGNVPEFSVFSGEQNLQQTCRKGESKPATNLQIPATNLQIPATNLHASYARGVLASSPSGEVPSPSVEDSAASLRSAAAHAAAASGDAGELVGQIAQILSRGGEAFLDPTWRTPKAQIAVQALLDEGIPDKTIILAAEDLANRPQSSGYGLLKIVAAEFHRAGGVPSASFQTKPGRVDGISTPDEWTEIARKAGAL